MRSNKQLTVGLFYLAEMKEFAQFPKGAQRYIRRSLDIALKRKDAIDQWARDKREAVGIEAQTIIYDENLPMVRNSIPKSMDIRELEPMFGSLVIMSAFDLNQNRLVGFGPYRFLYERMIGAAVRPWLPSAYVAASAVPTLAPDTRRAYLQNISETAATAAAWTDREPSFFPEWVEKIDMTAA